MHIERTNNNHEPHAVPDGASGSQRAGSHSRDVRKATDQDGTAGRSGIAELMGLVTGGPDVDRTAVAEARRLIDSGELDTPDAARRAAEAMLRLGP